MTETKKQKRIAVFICAISMENQQKNLDGILKAAKERDALCYIFTCHLNFQARVESQEGTYNIMSLPDLSRFDGAILMKNTIQYLPAGEALEKRILAAGIPAVSIDQDIPGMKSVMVGNYDAAYDVAVHMIEAHSAGRLYFVSGYPGNLDGEERKKAFLDACKEYEIPEENRLIFTGNYSIDSGLRAVDEVLEKALPLPDVFICANDQMAIGVIQRLKENGYRVPEDVAVTGFDGDGVADAYNPMITTVVKHQEEAGYDAVRLLFDEVPKKRILIRASLEEGKSCGCEAKGSQRGRALRGQFVTQSITIRQSGDFIRNMSSDFAEAETLDQFYPLLQAYIKVGDMKSCYFCLCETDEVFYREDVKTQGRVDLTNVNRRYTKTSTVPVAYIDGEFTSFGKYETGFVLPPGVEERDGAEFYVVAPVNYRDCCFGYMVTSNSPFALTSDLFFSWIANVGIALENIRKQILMRSMMERLNEMWVYDAMTKLYNRAGFFQLSEEYFSELRKRDAKAFLIFIDLDGLKKVNDTLGHESGDAYISSMGEILKKVKRHKDLAMRYGGDEFVLFGECQSEAEAGALVTAIEEEMKHYVFGDGSYILDASIGCNVCPAKEITDLSAAIHEADEKMYALKRQKKAAALHGGE